MQFETANITYKGLEDKGLTVTLIDENKKKWTIWKADYKNKSEDSEAWATLQSFKIGETFGVSYAEKDENFVGKDGKPVAFKRKTIYSILPVITNPSAKPVAQPKYTPISEDKVTDWDKIAVGKCQTVFLQAFIQSGKTFSEAKLQVIPARQLAELVVYGTQQADGKKVEVFAGEEDEAPLPANPPDEVRVEDIPF